MMIRSRMDRPHNLTPHELRFLRLLLEGRSNGEIATALLIHTNSVKTSMSRLFFKIGVSNRLAAAIWYLRNVVCRDCPKLKDACPHVDIQNQN